MESYLLSSNDSGINWKEYSTIGKSIDETAILMLSEKRMIAVARAEMDSHLSVGFSQDLGKSWSSFEDITEKREHPACLTLLSNGYILISYGYRSSPFGARAMISKDDGNTWLKDEEIILGDDAANWDCGYASTIRLKSGKLVTAYYSTPFPPEKVDSWSCKGAKLHVIIYEEKELLGRI